MRDRGRIRRQRRERISQGRRITRRETKTDRKQKKNEKRNGPCTQQKSVLASAAWKLKPFKGFFFINATNTECPDLSDNSPLSPLPSHYRFSYWEQMGKLDPLFFCSLRAHRSFSDHWMHAGTPALSGYWISLLPESLHSFGRKCRHEGTRRKSWEMIQEINKKINISSALTGIQTTHLCVISDGGGSSDQTDV